MKLTVETTWDPKCVWFIHPEAEGAVEFTTNDGTFHHRVLFMWFCQDMKGPWASTICLSYMNGFRECVSVEDIKFLTEANTLPKFLVQTHEGAPRVDFKRLKSGESVVINRNEARYLWNKMFTTGWSGRQLALPPVKDRSYKRNGDLRFA
jgi:hypothetical protein